MSLLKSVSLTAAALGMLALPALADWHGHRGCYGGGPRWSFGIGLGFPLFAPAAYYCPPPAPYYAPAPYYYEPAPVVVGRPVAVNREVCGDLVVDVQRALARKGYYRGAVDGDLGPQTRASLREWQMDCRLPATGRLDTATLRSLALL